MRSDNQLEARTGDTHPRRFRLVGCACAALCLCVALIVPPAHGADVRVDSGAAVPTIELDERDGATCVIVRGAGDGVRKFLSRAEVAPEFWRKLLSIYVAGSGLVDAPMLGAHRVQGADLVFAPRFPLRPGLEYDVVYNPTVMRRDASTRRIVRRLKIPLPPETPRAAVTQVYPTGDKLPENQLKFYIHFSAPMSRGGSYRHVRLLDGAREEVDRPFLELGEELWNASGTRFTLFFDPGRIKRGLKPREEVGPALVEGGSYSLVVNDTWRDATGAPLTDPFVKRFRVAAPDDASPNVKAWTLTAPATGTRDALVVRFDEPLDHALATRVIRVHNEVEGRVPGAARVSQGETRWEFTPDSIWRAGRYELVVAPELEDLAGNSVARPFEAPMDEPQQTTGGDEPRRLPFKVAAPASP